MISLSREFYPSLFVVVYEKLNKILKGNWSVYSPHLDVTRQLFSNTTLPSQLS